MAKNARRKTRKDKIANGEAPKYKNPKSISLVPKTEAQELYVSALRNDDLILVTGSAGTGKTYCAMTHAANLYVQGYINKIILSRPNEPADGRGLGWHKGTIEEKIAPWAAPAIDVLKEHLGGQKVEAMMKAEELVFEPFETMRGKSFKDAFVLLDEAQNTTVKEIRMFLTRIGENTQTVLNGDIFQTDMPYDCGMKKVITMAKARMMPFPVIEFSIDDIVRSDICAMWEEAFMEEGLAY